MEGLLSDRVMDGLGRVFVGDGDDERYVQILLVIASPQNARQKLFYEELLQTVGIQQTFERTARILADEAGEAVSRPYESYLEKLIDLWRRYIRPYSYGPNQGVDLEKAIILGERGTHSQFQVLKALAKMNREVSAKLVNYISNKATVSIVIFLLLTIKAEF